MYQLNQANLWADGFEKKSKNRLSEKVLEVSVSQCIVIQTMVQPSPTFF